MKVKNELNVLLVALNVMFEGMDDGVVELVGVGPATIGVVTDELCAGIAVDDAVDVYHRHDFEDEVVE